MADEQKDYKRALGRVEEAIVKLDKADGYLEVKKIYRVELETAIKALLDAKLNLLRSAKDEPKETDWKKRNRMKCLE